MAVAVERVASIPPFNGLDSDTQGRVPRWFDERCFDAGHRDPRWVRRVCVLRARGGKPQRRCAESRRDVEPRGLLRCDRNHGRAAVSHSYSRDECNCARDVWDALPGTANGIASRRRPDRRGDGQATGSRPGLKCVCCREAGRAWTRKSLTSGATSAARLQVREDPGRLRNGQGS